MTIAAVSATIAALDSLAYVARIGLNHLAPGANMDIYEIAEFPRFREGWQEPLTELAKTALLFAPYPLSTTDLIMAMGVNRVEQPKISQQLNAKLHLLKTSDNYLGKWWRYSARTTFWTGQDGKPRNMVEWLAPEDQR